MIANKKYNLGFVAPMRERSMAPSDEGLAKIGSSEPIFDWGRDKTRTFFSPSGPSGHLPHQREALESGATN